MSANPQTPFQSAHGVMVPLDKDSPPHEHAREQRDRLRDTPKLLEYLVKTCDSVEAQDRDERVRVREAQVRCQAYYDGRQDGKVVNGQWRDNEYIEGEIRPEDNQYKIQIDKLHMEMCRAQTRFTVDPADPSDAELKEAAKFFQERLTVNQERIETEPFLQAENMSLLLKTVTYRYSFFDAQAEGEGSETVPKVGKREGRPLRAVVCRTCGAPRKVSTGIPAPDTDPQHAEQVAGEMAARDDEDTQAVEATPCERCGDTKSREIAVPPSEGLDISYEEVPGGSVVTRRPDASAVQLDMSARDVPSSSFLRWRLSLPRHKWEAMFPGKRIPSGSEKSDEARYAEDLQGSPSNNGGYGMEHYSGGDAPKSSNDPFEKIEGDLVWLDREVYANVPNKDGETLPNGEMLPAGTPLASMFPFGMCIARIQKTVLDLYPSDKNKFWTMCVYGLREHALHGAGTLSLLGPQVTINDFNAYIQYNAYLSGAGREFLKDGAITGNELPPINRVGIINSGFEGQIVGEGYQRSAPSALSSDVHAFREGQRGSLQEHAGTSSLSTQGAADMRALGTATGVEAARDQAVGRMIPNLKLRAEMQREWAYQVGELERDNCTPERFLKFAGKGTEKGEVKFTERGVRAFFNSDVRRDFILRPVPGSWIPTTPAQEKANASEFGMIASKVTDTEILSTLAPKYGIEYDINEFGAVQRAAALRLSEYARVCGVITKAGYPASPELVEVVLQKCAPWARISPEMDNAEAYSEFYSDWYTSDEGMNADPLLRMVVERVHVLHREGAVYQAQQVAEGEAKAAIPTKLAQNIAAEGDARQAMELQEEAKDAEDEREMAHAAMAAKVAEEAGGEAALMPR
jgi:hypothetical protein